MAKPSAEEREAWIKRLVEAAPTLADSELYWLNRVISAYGMDHQYDLIKSDVIDEMALHSIGDALRTHHCFSNEPFSKDKFEHVLVGAIRSADRFAELAARGNPGHDATLGSERFSLKTQADRSVKTDIIWISKFMELGKGDWKDQPGDLIALREQFLRHLAGYDRIFTLRALEKAPAWYYELVEIPKAILLECESGRLEMRVDSRQSPKPGYCYVDDADGNEMYRLYFDGGTERKLQIKNLRKKYCTVHATWRFLSPVV